MMKKIIKFLSLAIILCMLVSNVCACDEYLTDDDKEIVNITITKDKDELIGKNYKEVEEYFKELGFTDIEFNTYTYKSGIIDGEVTDIEIIDWIFAEDEFSNGDVFTSDCRIEISYTKLEKEEEEKEDSEPVFYSTNDYETATQGNTGVFSYKNKKGSYDIYWIIDFDEGYVYNFTDGNGEMSCDKFAIISGDLNDRITIESEGVRWYLHFKYVEHPETLIVNDHIFGEFEYTTTDLSKALNKLDTKTIYER